MTHDSRAALAQYARRAPVYDLELALFEPVRRRAVARLALRPGEVVLDVGCGTGLSLPLLHAAVGSTGRIVGVEPSPEMMALADERTAREQWRNVTLVNASASEARLPEPADAVLFHFTHDVMRDAAALAHVLGQVKPGARVVACGLRWAAPWAWPVNMMVLPAALRSVTSLEGMQRPWSHLEGLVRITQVESLMGGGVYLASGVLAADPRPRKR
jgi:SAM-dependent methyltransferase